MAGLTAVAHIPPVGALAERRLRVDDERTGQTLFGLDFPCSVAAAVSVDGVPCRTAAYSRVKPEPVIWTVPERVPAAMITLLVGDPGLGKSTIALQ